MLLNGYVTDRNPFLANRSYVKCSICPRHPCIAFALWETHRLQFAKPYHRNLTSAGFSASSVEKYHYFCCFHRRIGSNPIFTSRYFSLISVQKQFLDLHCSVSVTDNSWRTADVADAFTPTTGTYLMNVYSVFKEQPAGFFGCV